MEVAQATVDEKPTRGGALAVLRLMRPKQWAKNLLVFAALLFTAKLSDRGMLLLACEAFLAMCLVSSATYVINDIADAERDKAHPRKRLRPIASGQVSRASAGILATLLLLGGLAIAFAINRLSLAVVIGYLLMQVLYNGWMKRTPVADVFCIAVGFVLRAVLGAAALAVSISGWLLFCTGALALMLGFAKRRQEFIAQGSDAASRESLSGYSKQALDALVMVFAGSAILCYGIYCLESPTAKKYPGLVITALFVAYGISRYLWLVFAQNEGEEPETLLFKDPHILASVVFFVAAAAAAMSGLKFPVVGG